MGFKWHGRLALLGLCSLLACTVIEQPLEPGEELLNDGDSFSGVFDSDTTISGELIVREMLRVEAGTTLTISPGTVIRFLDAADTSAGFDVAGVLLAQADSTAPIVLESAALYPEPGDWEGLRLFGGVALMSHVQLLHARIGIRIGGSSYARLDTCRIDSNSACGVLAALGRADLRSTNLAANPIGVKSEGGILHMSGGISRGEVPYRGHGGIDTLLGVTLDGIDGLVLDGARDSWVHQCTLTGSHHAARLINHVIGARVDSNAVHGDRVGIFLHEPHLVEVLNNTVSQSFEAGIECRRGDALISGNKIDSCGAGAWLEGDGASLVANQLLDNRSDGVRVDAGSPTITGNSISGNRDYGLWADVPQIVATDNWWGDASGPEQESYNPGGLGDRVPRDAVVDPWLISPPE